jgi:acetyltransferase-like isoleucine patch superfamily enzyme
MFLKIIQRCCGRATAFGLTVRTRLLCKSSGSLSYIDHRGGLKISWRDIKLGASVRISRNPRLEAISRWGNQYFAPSITIKDQTTIEQNVHISICGEFEIGQGCVISSAVFVTDLDHVVQSGISVQNTQIVHKKTTIGNCVFIGSGAKILAGARIGNNCIIGANAVVLGGVYPDGAILVGVPARVLQKTEVIGSASIPGNPNEKPDPAAADLSDLA